MLQLSNVKIYHLEDLQTIVEDLNFIVNDGEKVAIIGEEGTGKSTLLEWIYQPNESIEYVEISGRIVNNFIHMEYIPQFVDENNLKVKVIDFIFDKKNIERIDYNYLYKLASLLDLSVNLIHSEQVMEDLSGGERLKVQVLKALVMHPDLLLLDEPSNDLDIESIQWLEDFIIETDITILFISHDELFLSKTANKIVHLELEKHRTIPKNSVETLGYLDYVEQRRQSKDKSRQVALNQREEDKTRTMKLKETKSKVHNALGNAASSAEGRLLKKKMQSIKSTKKRFDREAENFEEIPYWDETIDLRFDKTKPLKARKDIVFFNQEIIQLQNEKILKNLKFSVKSFDKVGIIGSNGVGKSTFLKKIYQKLLTDETLSVGYMPQDYTDKLKTTISPVEYLEKTGSKEERTHIMTALGNLNFSEDEMSRSIQSLSGGQKSKLLLLEMELAGNNVLLLDEPTRNLSPLSQPVLREAFVDFEGTIITISHDRLFLKEVCQIVYSLSEDGIQPLNDLKQLD